MDSCILENLLKQIIRSQEISPCYFILVLELKNIIRATKKLRYWNFPIY
ncbi:hypothetical protein pb186bvf_007206 [Paramecium bursaria]